MKRFFFIIALLAPVELAAQSVVAVSAIRARALITPNDVGLIADNINTAYSSVNDVIGLEARVNIYPGRPITLDDVGPPAVIERNQIVVMSYNLGGLSISAEGRALDRAGVGESIRIMNLDSRLTVTGIVQPNGTVEVGS